jgi:hypothetical protein
MDNFYKGCPAKMADGRFLTDYRTANAREQYIKTINGFYRDDDYRMFLQGSADQIMDQEWKFFRTQISCNPTCCVHKYHTRTTPSANYEELAIYNAVQSGKLKSTDKIYPSCAELADYRMTNTSNSKY